MDFGSILHVAQKNEKLPKKEIKYYSTKFEPPKKEARSKQLSSNIKKFLARKEQEEKLKSVEAREKRDELLALRSQDKKATRRVSVMLKRTKSANKSVIQDAVDNVNTAVTINGPAQPDEDDYGYVSQEASAFYNKMMAKYSDMPEENKFRGLKKNSNVNLNGTKDRVRAALLKEQEDALLPHKRKRKPKEDSTNEPDNEKETYDKYEPESKSTHKSVPKPKKSLPPPMNFSELLKIAEKKQFEPILIEPKKEVKVDGRPMTKRQRREFEKERAWLEQRKERGLPPIQIGKEHISSLSKPVDKTMPPPNKIPKLTSVPSNNGKIPKLPQSDDRSKTIPKSSQSSSNFPRKSDDRVGIVRKSEDRPSVRKSDDRLSNSAPNSSSATDRRPHTGKVSKLRTELEKNRSLPPKVSSSSQLNGHKTDRAQMNRPTNVVDKNKNLAGRKESNEKSQPLLQNNRRPKQTPPAGLKPKQFPPENNRPKQFPPENSRPKQGPPENNRPKQFPPEDVRRRFPPKDVKRKPPMGNKMRILDDDEDYDSEMDDFIDDGPGESEDYSKYISEIFGYDKSRYRAEDYEDDNMESSFSQMMKEEFMSSKIGLLEDLEDMKKEAEDKKRKAMMKKGRK